MHSNSWLQSHVAGSKKAEVYNANTDGRNAPLTEDGYRAVVGLHNDKEMFQFASRIIDNEGYFLVEERGGKGNLEGMLHYYSCENGIQSLEHMRDELRGIATGENGWIGFQGPPSL